MAKRFMLREEGWDKQQERCREVAGRGDGHEEQLSPCNYNIIDLLGWPVM